MASAEPPSLQGVTDYTDGKGVLHLVGEVVNHSGQNVKAVEITASFYDSSGQLLTTESGPSSLHIVETGGQSPFAVMLPDPPEGIATYDLDLAWAETAEQPLAVEVVNHTGWVDAARLYHVDGEVRNPLCLWDVDPDKGFSAVNRRVIFDAREARLPLEAPMIGFGKLCPVQGKRQLLCHRVATHRYLHPHEGAGPITDEAIAACGSSCA